MRAHGYGAPMMQSGALFFYALINDDAESNLNKHTPRAGLLPQAF